MFEPYLLYQVYLFFWLWKEWFLPWEVSSNTFSVIKLMEINSWGILLFRYKFVLYNRLLKNESFLAFAEMTLHAKASILREDSRVIWELHRGISVRPEGCCLICVDLNFTDVNNLLCNLFQTHANTKYSLPPNVRRKCKVDSLPYQAADHDNRQSKKEKLVGIDVY